MSDKDGETENKVIFLGEAGVGKTSLIKVSIGENFESEYNSSITFSYSPKEVLYKNKKYIFNLWDTIGQEKYRSLTKVFYKNSKIVVFVYDITKKASFKNIEYWMDSVNNEIGPEKYIKAIVGNKSDLFLQEEVKEEEVKQFAISKECKFKICSAKKDPINFIKFLEELCIDCINNISKKGKQENKMLDKNKVKKNKKSCNC